jgi:NADH:ubiquinone oxidoreductase subunit 6 (subunit J)
MLGVVDWYACFFWLFATIACVFAVAVLFTPNVVRMAFYLVVSLGAVSGLFFLAGADFIGAMQLMIYVGGTLVLLIFGVMLTAQSRFINMRSGAGDWVVALPAGAALFLMLLCAAFMVPSWNVPNPAPEQIEVASVQTTTTIGLALTGVRLDGGSGYLLPFLIVSVHLLVVLVGAGYLARAKRRVDADQETA